MLWRFIKRRRKRSGLLLTCTRRKVRCAASAGTSAGAVGWLLMRCKRWAMPVHGVLVLIALGWAWRSQGSLGVALVQSAALWIPALWMTMRPVREGLD